MRPPILGNKHVAVLQPAKSLAPRDSFISFIPVQWTNSRLDFFKSCSAFSWAAPFSAFPNFRSLFSSARFYVRFWGLHCLGFGLGCCLFFLEIAVVGWVRDVLTMPFHGNFPCWRSLCVSPRHRASSAVPSNLRVFFSQWIPCHRSTQDLIMALHSFFFPCLLNISAYVFVLAHSAPLWVPLHWLLHPTCVVRGVTGLLNLLVVWGRGPFCNLAR